MKYRLDDKKVANLLVFYAIIFIIIIGLMTINTLYTIANYQILWYLVQEDVEQAPPELLFIHEDEEEFYHSWTKAIYDGNYIQDFYVECIGDKLINLTPIGEQVYVGKNWTDPRPVEWQNKWC